MRRESQRSSRAEELSSSFLSGLGGIEQGKDGTGRGRGRTVPGIMKNGVPACLKAGKIVSTKGETEKRREGGGVRK